MRDKKFLAFLGLVLAAVVASLMHPAAKLASTATFGETFSINSPVSAVTDWYIDPQNATTCASDTNSCTSATCGASGIGPCTTWGQIESRYGTPWPVIKPGIALTVHLLSSQPAGSDPVFFSPSMSGGGLLSFVGSPSTVSASFAAGTVTPKSPGAPGVRLQVASMPAGTLAGMLVFNATHPSYAFIDSMSGSTATMQQPLAPLSVTEVNTWAPMDLLTTLQLPNFNMKNIQIVGQDVNTSNAFNQLFLNFLSVPDTSNGDNVGLPIIGWGSYAFAAQVSFAMPVWAYGWSELVGCNFTNTVNPSFQTFPGTSAIYGGGFKNGITANPGSNIAVEVDATVHGNVNSTLSLTNFYQVFADGSFFISGGIFNIRNQVWGSFAMDAYSGANVVNRATSFAVDLTTTGAIAFGSTGATTVGYTPPVSGTFTNNGVTQVVTSGTFPANATVSWSLGTVGGVPCLAGGPYFSAAMTAGTFSTKAVTATCNDIYDYSVQPSPVTLTPTNMDTYKSLCDPIADSCYSITG
jgi:hypothetical protein